MPTDHPGMWSLRVEALAIGLGQQDTPAELAAFLATMQVDRMRRRAREIAGVQGEAEVEELIGAAMARVGMPIPA
jgi:hypothetical protein